MSEKIAVLTGGGDCPGLNAVIRAVVRSAHHKGLAVVGVRDGFKGAVEGDFFPLGLKDVSGLLPRGGTILGTTNRDNPFSYFIEENGKKVQKDCSGQILKNFSDRGIDSLIAIGGDGSLAIASQLTEQGLRVIGVPKTIDNDLRATDLTFGFQTAVETARDALDKLHTTAESHHRVMILEVMGRYAGWIALYAGIAGGADIILLPEIPYDLARVVQAIQDRVANHKKFSIIVAAEGARSQTGEMVIERRQEDRPDPIRLGGIGAKVAGDLESLIDLETRVTVLGHLQRGGSPNAFDRILATRYGAAAVQAVLEKKFNTMVALKGQEITTVPLKEAIRELKRVDADNQVLLAARQIGIKFGD
ncbi:6-phosphofructokinase [Syntrophobotulus glycolicus DSM 8271]|uniref:ATP-dependent 6-phosphofructokinase n=1 Tax=Syntrophobotulus glycolicus (strain DSM 8271 / FlGlyR) TaxID=645991 RepID=F0T0K6_SYNGF|nr:ATP-dependent 6-phosphofructokinase [Syntrophobotulus glycolicus]ADY55071.1 6-phosphofructokinase [Syntrophobotulus glycolicus DSM 8271]